MFSSGKAALYSHQMNRLCLRLLGFTLGFAAALSLSFAAFAQQYKWVDKDGRVQYGDSPPPGVKATPLRAPAGAAAAASPAGKSPATTADKDADFRKRQAEASKASDKQAAAAQDAEARKQNCANAQEAVRTIEQGRVRRIDSKGESYFLDDNQLVEEMAKAKKAVTTWCG
jgi:hypothetical protein